MADMYATAGNPSSATTTIQRFEISSAFVRESSAALSNAVQPPANKNGNAKRARRLASRLVLPRFSVPTLGHPLDAVRDALLFQGLSPAEFREVAGAGQERVFSHNRNIFAEGDPLRWISIITAGHTKSARHSIVGKVMILDLCGPGDVLDGLGSSPGSRHSVEARAVQHCRLFSWDVGRFELLSNKFPVLQRNSTRLLLARLRILENRVHELATERVPQRLAKVLLRLILQYRSFVPDSLVELTGEDLAQIVGTTQFTVSRLLCDWAAQGIIQPGRTAVLAENLPGLLAIAMQVESAK